MDFDFSVDSIELEQAFLLTISVILTMQFNENIEPSTNFTIFYYHAIFYIFWIIFLYIIVENLTKPNNSSSEKEITLYQIMKNKHKMQKVIMVFGKSKFEKDFLDNLIEKLKSTQAKILIIMISETTSGVFKEYSKIFY